MGYMNKKGISLVMATAAVTIMLLLISVASVVGSNAINTANFDEYISSINRVADDINEYHIANEKLPITSDSVNISSISDDFKSALIANNDKTNRLYVVDIVALEDTTIKKGNGTIESGDVFLVAENSHNVYYMKGYEYKGKVYYGV